MYTKANSAPTHIVMFYLFGSVIMNRLYRILFIQDMTELYRHFSCRIGQARITLIMSIQYPSSWFRQCGTRLSPVYHFRLSSHMTLTHYDMTRHTLTCKTNLLLGCFFVKFIIPEKLETKYCVHLTFSTSWKKCVAKNKLFFSSFDRTNSVF